MVYKTILFAQSRSPLEKSTMVINGDVFEADSKNNDLQKAFDYLVGFNSQRNENLFRRGLHSLQHTLFRVEKWCKSNEISSLSQFDIRKSDKGIFIKSTYIDTDEGGRKMQFMFYANTQEETEACEWLKESSSKIGRHLNEAELDTICNGKKKAYITLIIVSIVICVIILLIVQYLLNRTNDDTWFGC